MSLKVARGTKRVCPNCGSKFYDLNRAPITCPICETVYQQQETRGKAAAAAAAGNASHDDDDDAISPTMANVDMVSLDEVAEAENDLPDIDDDGLVDIDDEADLKADDDETFIEDEDDSG